MGGMGTGKERILKKTVLATFLTQKSNFFKGVCHSMDLTAPYVNGMWPLIGCSGLMPTVGALTLDQWGIFFYIFFMFAC